MKQIQHRSRIKILRFITFKAQNNRSINIELRLKITSPKSDNNQILHLRLDLEQIDQKLKQIKRNSTYSSPNRIRFKSRQRISTTNPNRTDLNRLEELQFFFFFRSRVHKKISKLKIEIESLETSFQRFALIPHNTLLGCFSGWNGIDPCKQRIKDSICFKVCGMNGDTKRCERSP